MTSPLRWIASIAATAVLAACAPAPRLARAGPMRVGLFAAPLSLDPHLENEFLTSAVLANVFEGLTSLDGGMRVVTARDVAWSLERTRRHPRSGVSHDLADVVPWCLS